MFIGDLRGHYSSSESREYVCKEAKDVEVKVNAVGYRVGNVLYSPSFCRKKKRWIGCMDISQCEVHLPLNEVTLISAIDVKFGLCSTKANP